MGQLLFFRLLRLGLPVELLEGLVQAGEWTDYNLFVYRGTENEYHTMTVAALVVASQRLEPRGLPA